MTAPGGPPGFTTGSGTANAGEALKHLATAFAFLLLGLGALVLNSPLLAAGGARDAKVVAGLHFLTLGWLSMSIFGALQVFSGVALGGPPLDRRLSAVARWIWAGGVLLFVFGFLAGRPASLVGGFLALGFALALYTAQIVPALIHAKRGQITRVFIGLAFFSLWCAWLLGTGGGLARAGRLPAAFALPPGYLHAHLLLAIFGWVGSMIIGVGSHLVPMFALSRGGSTVPLKLALAAWLPLPVAGILSAFFPEPWVAIGWTLAAAGCLAWAFQFRSYLRARVRRERDHGLRIAALATIFLLLAWIAAGLLDDPTPFIALTIVGWLCFFTLGIYHRIVPFLVWFVRFSRPAKLGPPLKVKDLTDPRIGRAVETLVAAGLLIWFFGLWRHSATAAFAGSVLMAAGALTALLQLKTLLGSPGKEARLHGTFGRKNPATP